MSLWSGLFSVIVLVDDDNCGYVTTTIEAFNEQTWPRRELILINSSSIRFGLNRDNQTEIIATSDSDLLGTAAGIAIGEYCVVFYPGRKTHPDCLFRFASCVGTHTVVEMVQNSDLVAKAFFRRAVHLVGTLKLKTIQIESGFADYAPWPNSLVECTAPDTDGKADQNNLNILCPAGIGDVLWIFAKLGLLAKALPVTFWLPDGEQHRAGALARLCGFNYGYLKDLATSWVWSQPGSPPLTDKGWVTVQANRHLEAGKHLRDWYPQFPIAYPKLRLNYVPVPESDYVIGFMCLATYMGGQLVPQVWGRIFDFIEATVAPVKLIGAGSDVAFAREVEKHYHPKVEPMYNRPLEEVLPTILKAKAVVGVASGLLITSIVYGVPSLISYPRHLLHMPGTWEPAGSKWDWCFHDRLEETVSSRKLSELLR